MNFNTIFYRWRVSGTTRSKLCDIVKASLDHGELQGDLNSIKLVLKSFWFSWNSKILNLKKKALEK